MHKKILRVLFVVPLLISITSVTAATPTVKIFSYEEVLTTQNLSKPRIYIQNLSGSVPISNFYYYYYFTVENNKTPAPPEDYYTPNSIPTLESLGNGNYRIKFTFLGVTLQPGQILPNTSGEVIGIRYTDWSPLDKTNDHSNNMSTNFALNPNIPVFLADGTQIYGNSPPNPANPPQPPTVYGMTGDFVVYSEEYTDLRDRVKITGGNIGSLNYLELGCDDTIYGTVLSKGNVFLRERARIYGDVTSSQVVSKQNSVYIQGTSRNYAKMELPVLPTPTVTIGTLNVPVSPGGSYTLVPGAYNSFHAYANVTLTIQPGEYSFREFILETNVTVLLNVGSGDFIDLKVRDNCNLGNGINMSLPAGVTSPFALSIHSAQTSQMNIGTDATIKGLIYAPDAEVHVYSRTTVAGSIYGKRVIVEPSVQFCKPPTLMSFSHSEGAMAPPFDPMVFKYVAVVPDATATLTVTPIIRPGQSVTVNGNSPSDPVNLTGSETDIVMVLTHPEACGNTAYKLKVKRSANYAIYVDPNSPCTPGTETGTTWYSAWKKIDDAINNSVQTGQQLCLREGVYKPTVLANPPDARSATFLIPCGTEIVGGFLGTETDGEPLGSAYNTILSGDVNNDDGNFTNWPPSGSDLQYVDDNVYHVVTGNGSPSCNDSRISNLVVSGAYANGTGTNSSGAIYVKSGNMSLELVAIIKNYSQSGGAGILVTESGSLNPVKNCLFQNNYSNTKSGAGIHYLSKKPLVVEASVFDNNTTCDASSSQGGSALYFVGAVVTLVNSVFAENKSFSVLGAVLNNGGTLSCVNCTFADNTSTGAVSICNLNSGNSTVLNCILWNKYNKDEVSGTNFTINYSCLTKIYTGTGNFSTNPMFIDQVRTSGTNGKWGDFDDGLRLSTGSPCIYSGWKNGSPDEDILTITRDNPGYYVDLGAYTYVYSNTDGVLGKFNNGAFEPRTYFDVVDDVASSYDILSAMSSGYPHVIEVELPKNKYTDRKNSVVVEVFGQDVNGNLIGKHIPVVLYRVESTQKFRSYIDSNGGTVGKPIIFVKNMTGNNADGGEHYLSYLIRASEAGSVKITLNKNQFN